MVRIMENADADMLAFAIEEAGDGVVLVPYRYYAGAVRYSAQNPGAPVAVLGGRGQAGMQELPGVTSIGTDSLTDFYRAGSAAAVLAGEGRIAFFHERDLTERERGVFLQGLRDHSYKGEPVFLPPGAEYDFLEDVSCAVLSAPAPSFWDRYADIPLIIFSWVDPALTPSNVCVIFDDSPWALAAETVKLLVSRDENTRASLPSRVLFPSGRVAESGVLRKLKDCAGKRIPVDN